MSIRSCPAADSGRISPETVKLRPLVSLTPYEKRVAKSLRASGEDFEKIADRLKRDVVDVEISLSTIRTKRTDPSRFTANISEAAHVEIEKMKIPGEATWETVNRLLGIH